MNSTHLRIGLPQWNHTNWKKIGLDQLKNYASFFNCVEGNTTFYALPKKELILKWLEMTPGNFRFCFKFPYQISHQAALKNCSILLKDFFKHLAPLENKIGQFWLQLPASFNSSSLNELVQFIKLLPKDFEYGIEVRHLEFFNKGSAEKTFNEILMKNCINRVMLDSRALHNSLIDTPATQHAQIRKPRVPLHVIATANSPFIRFIGSESLETNRHWFYPWINKIKQWCKEGKTVYLFIHTPDNKYAPQHAVALCRDLPIFLPELLPSNQTKQYQLI